MAIIRYSPCEAAWIYFALEEMIQPIEVRRNMSDAICPTLETWSILTKFDIQQPWSEDKVEAGGWRSLLIWYVFSTFKGVNASFVGLKVLWLPHATVHQEYNALWRHMYCACVLHTLDEESQMHVNVGDEGSDTRRYMETSSCRPPVSPFHNGWQFLCHGWGVGTLQCNRIVVQTKCKTKCNTKCKPHGSVHKWQCTNDLVHCLHTQWFPETSNSCPY